TAIDAGPKGRDDAYGYGRVDVVAALTADVPPAPAESAASSQAAATPADPGDDSDPRAFARTVPLLLGLGAAGIVLIIGAVVLIAMARRRREG
ncbi:hypothetical protein AB0M20_40095, partial [Actinoplanes sp. NPDC051633]